MPRFLPDLHSAGAEPLRVAPWAGCSLPIRAARHRPPYFPVENGKCCLYDCVIYNRAQGAAFSPSTGHSRVFLLRPLPQIVGPGANDSFPHPPSSVKNLPSLQELVSISAYRTLRYAQKNCNLLPSDQQIVSRHSISFPRARLWTKNQDGEGIWGTSKLACHSLAAVIAGRHGGIVSFSCVFRQLPL